MARTYIDSNGYRRFAGNGIAVHRWMAEKKLGRKLKGTEVVHHIDRNKTNNTPQNLWVCKNQMQHDKIHKIDARKFGPGASYRGFPTRKYRRYISDQLTTLRIPFL
jgi:hypothetical protein